MGKDKKGTHSSDNNLDKISNKKIKKNNRDKSSENILESTGEQIDKLFDKQFSELSEDKSNLEKQQEKKYASTDEQIDKLLNSQFPELSEDKSNLKKQQKIKNKSTEEPLDKFTVKTQSDDDIKEEDILVLDESLTLPEEPELSSESSTENKNEFQDLGNLIFKDLEPKADQSSDINKNKELVQDKEFHSIEIEEPAPGSTEQKKSDVFILENTQHLQEDDNNSLSKEVISENLDYAVYV